MFVYILQFYIAQSCTRFHCNRFPETRRAGFVFVIVNLFPLSKFSGSPQNAVSSDFPDRVRPVFGPRILCQMFVHFLKQSKAGYFFTQHLVHGKFLTDQVFAEN